MTRVEAFHENQFWYTAAFIFNCLHYYMIGDLLEDMVFGDLGTKLGLWNNWGTYGPTICIIFQVLVLNHLISPHEFGVLRNPKIHPILMIVN